VKREHTGRLRSDVRGIVKSIQPLAGSQFVQSAQIEALCFGVV